MDEFTIQVRIDEPRKESSNFFVVFLDPLLMKKMNLKKGNFVSLIGEKKTAAIVHIGKSSDKGLGLIRIDSRLRSNLGKNIGDFIQIEKTKIYSAEKLDLIPIRRSIFNLVWSNDKTLESNEVRKGLLGFYPISLLDKIYITRNLMISRNKYVVASLLPDEVCFVDNDTKITIFNESVNGFDEIAINLFNEILKIDPIDKDVWVSLGLAYMREMNYEKAEEAYKNAIQISSDLKDFHIWTLLGIIYNKRGEYDKAIDALETAKILTPDLTSMFIFGKRKSSKSTEFKNNHEIPYYLGYAYKQKRDYQKAIEYYNIVIDMNPNYKDALNELGMIYHTKGEHLKAIDAFNKSLNINLEEAIQQYVVFPGIFGIIDINAGEFKQSYQYIQFKKNLDLQNFNALYNLAKIYLDLKKFDKALHSCEESLKIDPKSEEALILKDKILKLQIDP